MDFFKTLEYITAPNSDNGKYFVDDSRLVKIDELLFHSQYRKVNPDGLFVLYAKRQLCEIKNPVVISSHVDCVPENMKCFVRHGDADRIKGTFDNLITNAAVLNLMVNNELPDNVLVAFTGDEEEDSKGAKHLCRFLARRKLHARIIVLDVTDMGWQNEACFSVENNFWSEQFGRAVTDAVKAAGHRWVFVPSDTDDIPEYVPVQCVIHDEAEEDESWEYDDHKIECFSLCLPVKGDMHSSQGVIAKKKDCLIYVKMLKDIVCAI